MTMEKIVRRIPTSLRSPASEKLIDLILNSSNANKMPSHLAKTILYYWQRDQIATAVGLERLLEASMILEPEKATSVMEDLGLAEIVVMLRET